MTREIRPITESAAETAHFLQVKEQRLSDRQRLIALYDAAAECRCDVWLREAEEPDAANALRLWASARRMTVASHSGVSFRSIEVETSRFRIITVYLLGDREAA